ncbi:MAG: FHA domain-containing protein [Proteobacteria bacterium]|nr:FHA domain-containing protein [Pseudomonadota bacterium]
MFVGTYASFAATCREIREPGVALVAIDERTCGVAGLAVLRARADRHLAAIVGRHDACDLFLSANDTLPLRQLAVILDPVTSWRPGPPEVNYRILDLRTETGFADEHGRPLRGLRCDGSAVLRCAGHALYVLPLGDPTDWPESGADAWAFQPERVYFDELTHPALGTSTRVPNLRRADAARTHVTAIRGPRETSANLVADGDLAGTLELAGPSSRETIPVGHAALGDGVLVGRYSRCDSARVDDHLVSRVHALLIQIDEQLLVIDTASSNGTARPGEEPERVHAIDGETELQLGATTRASWRWVS